jgi:hypothetical protein
MSSLLGGFYEGRGGGRLDIREIHKQTAIIAVVCRWRLAQRYFKDKFGRLNDKPRQLHIGLVPR